MVFIIVGQVSGNQAITQSMRTLAAAPAGLVTTLRNAAPAVREFLTSVASDAVAPLLVSANATIQGAVDINAAVSNSQCIVSGVQTSLPNATVLLAFVASANVTVATVRNTSAALQSSMAAITTALAATRPAIVQATGNLTALYAAIGPLNTTVGAASVPLAEMQGYLTAFQSPVSGLPAIAGALKNFTAFMPPQAAANETGLALTQLASGAMNGNGNSASRAALLGSLVTINANISTLPNLNTTATNLLGLNSQIMYLRGNRTIDVLVGQLGAISTSVASLQVLPPALNVRRDAPACTLMQVVSLCCPPSLPWL